MANPWAPRARRGPGRPNERVRDALKEYQDNRCAICDRDGEEWPLKVDRDVRGTYRGLLCRSCDTLVTLSRDGRLLEAVRKFLDDPPAAHLDLGTFRPFGLPLDNSPD